MFSEKAQSPVNIAKAAQFKNNREHEIKIFLSYILIVHKNYGKISYNID